MDWSELMYSAATQARKQQDEYKLQIQDILKSHEQDIKRIQIEHETYVAQLHLDAEERFKLVEREAAREIDHVKREMEHDVQVFREESIKAAEETIASRQEALELQYQSQRERLAQECELILNEKDEEFKRCMQSTEEQHLANLERLDHQHRTEMEELRNEVWNAASNEMKAEHDRQISQVVAEADDRCKLLHDEIELLRNHLQAKDDELRTSAENISDMDKCFADVAREINARHNNEMARLSEENLAITHQNKILQGDLKNAEDNNASLNEELHQLKSKYRSIELEVLKRDEIIRTLEQRKTDFQSCKQILESQVSELKSDNSSLTKALELKTASLFELTTKADMLKTQVASLNEKTHILEDECSTLKRRNVEANELLEAFEREKRRNAQEFEYRITQKEGQIAHLTEAIDTMSKKSNSKTDPVVVHLHGDQGEARRRSVADSNECHHLRSRMLELQRSNYRLESDLMDAKRASQAKEDTLAADKSALNVDQLQQENHSLKQIITMMRKEMEQLSPEDKSNDDEAVPSCYILALEHQLAQCRAYLDILLKSRDFRSRAGGEDELHFLRTRYRELHEVLDQVRDENLRLQGHSAHLHSQQDSNHPASIREQELIAKLEEAFDEIEGLIEERDNLLKMCNGLKDERRLIDDDQSEICSRPRYVCQQTEKSNNDKNLMSAILNDMSGSFDGESQTASSARLGNKAVACFGNRPPRSTPFTQVRNTRPTASSRTTESQRQSLQRMASKTTKSTVPRRVRNWNNSRND